MNGHASASNTSKVERKCIEKNRRLLMKTLCSQLVSIIPVQQPAVATKNDQLDLAIEYIKELKERIQCMKDNMTTSKRGGDKNMETKDEMLTCSISVSIEERYSGTFESIVIRGLRSTNFILSEVVRLLGEEGLAIINFSFSSTRDSTVFLTIHTQVICARIGVDIARLRERLTRLFN